ncbi:GNAT family N-acetyltransferase [Lewinella sp. JB7]|uniref:GNAT family N-acetyltransferase n=1 Tax=Lewinella sp. JB7 TaxID=2962887 RepID=UPI0020CA04D8|nr:GNAT family N-acetyltransferase [Lewinella sp. JB7]MCP9235414.1 GNAT family N-acetyltransferase [Lewinella sp. JB7]
MRIRLLLPEPEELRTLIRGADDFRGRSLVPGALPPRVILDQYRYFPTGTARAYRWTVPYLIEAIPDNLIVGTIGGKGLLDGEDEVELGYNVAPEYRRRGIMTAAIAAVTRLARRDELKLIAHLEPDNRPSRIVLERNGFVHESTVSLPASFALERWRWSPD